MRHETRDGSTWLWRTPHRRIHLVNATGTHPLGNTELAQTIWRAANPPQQLASRRHGYATWKDRFARPIWKSSITTFGGADGSVAAPKVTKIGV